MSLRYLFKKHRNSITELTNDHDDECNDLQDRIDELELELEFERSKRSDAVSYAQSMKENRMQREEARSEQQDDESSAQKEKLSELEDAADKLEKKIMEKYETEAALRQELDDKDKIIEDLRHTVADQDKLISQLGRHLMSAMASSHTDSKGDEEPQERRTSLDELMARLQSMPMTSDMLEETLSGDFVEKANKSCVSAMKSDADDHACIYPPRCSSKQLSLREDSL